MKLKLRSSVRFLASIFSGVGTAVRKDGLATYVDVDFSGLQREDDVTPTELASLYVGAWDAVTRTFRLYLGSSLKGETGEQGDPGPSDPSGFGTVANVAGATISAPVLYVRTAGFSAPGDGGGALYKRVISEPSHSGKIQSADGAWWEYVIDGPLSILQFGGSRDGATANDTAFNAAWSVLAATGSTGGCICFPAGKNMFASQVAKTLPVSRFAITLAGDGSGASTLYWPNASGGIQLTAGDIRNSFHIRDLQITTNQVSGGSALKFIGLGNNNGTIGASDIENVTISGDDINNAGTPTKYWTTAVWAHNWGTLRIFNLNTFGLSESPGGGGGGSVGLIFEGDTATESYATILDVQMSTFNFHGVGAKFGSYWQGITVNQCNFNGGVGTAGIQVDGADGLLSLLTVTDSQLNTGGNQINMLAPAWALTVTGCTITPVEDSHIGINAGTSPGIMISSNFINTSGPAAGTGIGIVSDGANGVISGNVFAGLVFAIALQADSSNVVVGMNAYTDVGTKIINSGTGNSIGTAAAGNMTGVVP